MTKKILHYPRKLFGFRGYLCNQACVADPEKYTTTKRCVNCKNCRKELKKIEVIKTRVDYAKWRKNNLVKMRNYMRAYRKEHPEYIKEQNKRKREKGRKNDLD